MEDRRERREILERLTEVHRAVTDSSDFDETLRLIVLHAADLLQADASMLLLSEEGGPLRLRVVDGIPAPLAPFFVSPGEDASEALRRLLSEGQDLVVACLPIDEALSGVLAVARAEPLSPDESWLLSALADQAAVTLRNSRFHERQVEQRRRESVLLASVTRELSTLLEVGGVMPVVTRAARDLVGAEGASFVLREGDWVHHAEIDAIEPLWKGRRFGLEQCAAGWAILKRAPAVVEDVETDPRVESDLYRGTFVQSLAAVPLHRPLPLGCVVVYWSRRHQASQREIELLESLADAAAIALVNSQLYESMKSARLEAERRAEALMRLQEASVGLLILEVEPPTPDRLTEILCRVAGAPRGIYWLLEERAGGRPALEVKGTHGIRRTPRTDTDHQMLETTVRVKLEDEHPAAVAARTRSLVWLMDTRNDERWARISGIWEHTGIRCALAVPLRARGRLLGVVALCWTEVGRCLDESMVNTVEVMANQVAAALDTASLVEELSRANRLKDEFLATLSHELRNPLNVIVGYTELLSRSPEAQNVALVRQAAEVIRRSALAQAHLVSDLLDLSRLQTGKLAIQRRTLSLAPAISDAVEAVRVDSEGKGVALDVELPEEPILVEADAVRVQQIAWNLLDNAVKFTPTGGRVRVALFLDGDEAKLEVEDSGQGIDPGFLPSVFEMFRQADSGLSRRHGGMGIGLALVRQLVELHGGRVRAESDGIGRGSRFQVWLPLIGAPAEPLEAASALPRGSLAGFRVLVVDDSPDTVSAIGQLLEIEGARVTTATSGDEALQRARKGGFDLVLSDISMPGMDGYELLQKLRARPETDGLPVIAMTGFGQPEDLERGRAAGFYAYITKPVQIPKLLETARAAVAGGSASE